MAKIIYFLSDGSSESTEIEVGAANDLVSEKLTQGWIHIPTGAPVRDFLINPDHITSISITESLED